MAASKPRKRRHETAIQSEAEEDSRHVEDSWDLPPTTGAATSRTRKKTKNNRAPFMDDSDDGGDVQKTSPEDDEDRRATEKDIAAEPVLVSEDENSYSLQNDPVLELAFADEEDDEEEDWMPPPPTPKGTAAKKTRAKKTKKAQEDAEPSSSEPPKGLRLAKLSRKSIKSREVIGYIFDDDVFTSPFGSGAVQPVQKAAPLSKEPPKTRSESPTGHIAPQPQTDNTGKQVPKDAADKPMADVNDVSIMLPPMSRPPPAAPATSIRAHASDSPSVESAQSRGSLTAEALPRIPSPPPQPTVPSKDGPDMAGHEATKETQSPPAHTGNQRLGDADAQRKRLQVAQPATRITTNAAPTGSLPSDAGPRRPPTVEAAVSPPSDTPTADSSMRQEAASDSSSRQASEGTRTIVTEPQAPRHLEKPPTINSLERSAGPRRSTFRRHHTTLASADGGHEDSPDVAPGASRGHSLPPGGRDTGTREANSADHPTSPDDERVALRSTVKETATTAAAATASAVPLVEPLGDSASRPFQRQASTGRVGFDAPPSRPISGVTATAAAAARSIAAGVTAAALAPNGGGSRPRIANPATRGRKAAVKSDAAGRAPQHVLPPDAGLDLAAIRKEMLAAVAAGTVPASMAAAAGATRDDKGVAQAPPKPKITMKFPGFTSASTAGPWSREAHDLLGMGRPGG